MLDDTWPQYLFIRGTIFVLRNIGPVCFHYTVWSLLTKWWTGTSSALPWSLQCYAFLEAAWYLVMQYLIRRLQCDAIHPPLRSREDRKALFTKVQSEIHDYEKFLSGWFRGANVADIGREELKRFLSWAFWDGRAGPADAEEMDEYMRHTEAQLCSKIQNGNGKAKSLRLTLDPILMDSRCLLWYGLMFLADIAAHINMGQVFVFRKFDAPVFPPRPWLMMDSSRSEASSLAYWIRPHSSKTRLPILHIHGIGIGLLPHSRLLRELDRQINADAPQDDQVGIIALEILQISNRLTSAIPPREQLLRDLTTILDANGYERFILVSHSYGSVLSTQLLKHAPLASRVSAAVLIDPITLLLHMPTVAYNFTVRPPRTAADWQLWHFASQDPCVAHCLGRHFFWYDNVLWRDELMALVKRGLRVTISIGGRDLIIDAEAVAKYVTEHVVPDPTVANDHMELDSGEGSVNFKQRKWTGSGLDLMWWEDYDHAQVFYTKRDRGVLVDVIDKYCRICT